MQQLPDEILLHILLFLPPWELVQLQLTSHRLLALGRDAGIWKTTCFESSRAEASRRRRDLLAQQNTLAELRLALRTLPAPWNQQGADGDDAAEPVVNSDLDSNRPADYIGKQARAFANWDPTAPGERIDWYEEYLHRHGPLSVGWLETPRDGIGHPSQLREALGMDTLYSRASATSVVAPLDDGSICIWDLSASGSSGRLGSIAGRSKAPTLHIATNLKEETGAIDNVSVDSTHKKAYIAIGTQLTEVDLTTLQICSQQAFPFAITALSSADFPTPMTIGTINTLHQYDPRLPLPSLSIASPSPVEHIAGAHTSAEAPLPQPGPLAILHPPDSQSIWVAGRFTSLLHYDRRVWPRLAGTTFSGARLSALAHLPLPFHPPSSSTLHHAATGTSVLAAGAYKGKGSLELYPLPPASSSPSSSTAAASLSPASTTTTNSGYQNRQTASRARILTATPHGARILFADGDGALKWVERDACAPVRATSLAQLDAAGRSFVFEDVRGARGRRAVGRVGGGDPHEAGDDAGDGDGEEQGEGASEAGPRSAAYLRARRIGERERAEQAEDVVQKVVPVRAPFALSASSPHSTLSSTEISTAAAAAGGGGVMIQTGEGRIGMLAFTRGDPLVARWRADGRQGEEQDEVEGEAWQRWREETRERRYDAAMRSVLETQAREMWWVRGLGL